MVLRKKRSSQDASVSVCSTATEMSVLADKEIMNNHLLYTVLYDSCYPRSGKVPETVQVQRKVVGTAGYIKNPSQRLVEPSKVEADRDILVYGVNGMKEERWKSVRAV